MIRILIVDDSKLILHAAKDTLLRHEELQAEIFTCDNGNEALKVIDNENIDLVLLDIMMPLLSGIEVLQILNADGKLNTLKVLMFSSITDKKALKECFLLGASDFIAKPIEEDEFIARISGAINEQKLKNKYRATIDLMKKQNDKLTKLYQQLADAQNQMIQQEQMAGVGHLAAGIAHEINNPIGFIKSNLASMNMYMKDMVHFVNVYNEKFGPLPANTPGIDLDLSFIIEDSDILYSEIRQGIIRIENIVNSLRSFSIVDNTNPLIEVNLAKSIEDMIILLNSELKGQIELERDFHPVDLLIVNGGEVHLALLNILKNAIYAVKESPKEPKKIKVTINADAQFVYCHIWDNGVGISEEDLKSIFNPFFTTKPVGDGIGLGLSMSYDIIVNKHKGRVEAISKKEEWTNISIGLPKQT